jgi:transcriptional regulator with XRE-family HTH domain
MGSIFPRRLKELREKNKWTQQQLGEMIRSTDVTISRYEKGLREPDLDILDQFANIFDVTVDYLLGREKGKKISEEKIQYGQITAPFPSDNNPMHDLPEDALKELEHYTEYLYQKWKGWKPGDPPR